MQQRPRGGSFDSITEERKSESSGDSINLIKGDYFAVTRAN